MTTNDVIQQIIPLLGDNDEDVQEATLKALFALENKDTGAAEIITLEMKNTILRMLSDPNEAIVGTALRVLTTLFVIRFNTDGDTIFVKTISTPEILEKIVSLLDNVSLTETALSTIIIALSHEQNANSTVTAMAVFQKLSTLWEAVTASGKEDTGKDQAVGDVLEKVLERLDDQDWPRTRAAIEGTVALFNHANIPMNSATDKMLSMLTHSSWRIRQAAVQVIGSLTKDDAAPNGSRPDFFHKIFSTLEDRDEDVREAALKAVGILSKHDECRKTILGATEHVGQASQIKSPAPPRVLENILSLLADEHGPVRFAALQVVVVLSTYEDFGEHLAQPNALEKILPVMVGEDEVVHPEIPEAMTTFAENREYICAEHT
ncbi:armadillo-type protein [Mycena rebaudengoi]|nr:armadillo-type protein [Mycena rebaudengoi]